MWLAPLGKPYLFYARACASTCVRAQYPFDDVERDPERLRGEGVALLLKTSPKLRPRLRHSELMPYVSPRAAVAAHEKHRPSGVRTRRRQSPLIAMYSKLCPACRASPPLGGAGSRGVKYYKIIVIFQVLFHF